MDESFIDPTNNGSSNISPASITYDIAAMTVASSGTTADAVREAARMLLAARRPVLYAGQGVHWAEAWGELKELAELLAIPVCTSLPGKSGFDETHPLALGSGGAAMPRAVRHFLDESDLIFGVGCSFTETGFAVAMPRDKPTILRRSELGLF